MAASDSTPLPLKNQALQITFGLWLTTGLVNTGAAGLDSEISKDNGAYADCTNEATEIGSSGTYTLDLTGTEMNADVVAIQVKSSTTNAITYKITIYPSSGSKMQVNAVQVGSQTASAAGTVTFPGTVASATNITAGTITTVTNLTNAPTSGDFTSTMKTSLNAATPAVTVSDKTGFSLANGSFVTATFGTCDLTSTMKTSVTTAATAATPTLAGTQTFNNTGTWTGNIVGTLSTVTTLTNLPAITANWLTATGIATDAITAAKIADGAIDTATFASGTAIPRVTLCDTTTTNTDMRGTNSAALAATALSTAVWTAPPAGFLAATFPSTVSSYAGGAVASVTGAVGSVTGLSNTTISAAVWDLATSGHTTSGTFGAAMISASSAGDPWNTAIPGSYASGTAGFIVGNNINATISSRLATSGYTAPPSASTISTQVNSDLTTAHGSGSYLTATGFATIAQAVKLLAATYDSASLSGSTMTLSNAATQTVTSTGRVTT